MSIKSKIRSILKIDPRTMRKMRKIIAPFRRIGLKKKFTLFADNCWGGRLYDKFSLQYLSPTIGLAMDNFDFIKFLEDYEYYLNLDLEPVYDEQKQVNDEWGFCDCLLGDIRIKFRHYRDVNDAINKWNRRKKRIIKDNIIVKMTYFSQEIDESLLDRFDALPFKKILFVTSKELITSKYSKNSRIVFIPKNEKESEFIISDSNLKLKELKKIINT